MGETTHTRRTHAFEFQATNECLVQESRTALLMETLIMNFVPIFMNYMQKQLALKGLNTTSTAQDFLRVARIRTDEVGATYQPPDVLTSVSPPQGQAHSRHARDAQA